MAYNANVYDATNPTDAISAETATQEFQAIKGFVIGTFARVATVQSLVNIGTVVNLLAISIPAGIMGINRKLRCTVHGAFFNNVGGVASCSIGASFGAQQLGGGIMTAPPGQYGMRYTLEIGNNGAANLQSSSAMLHLFAAGSVNGTLVSEVAGYPTGAELSNTCAVNTAAPVNLIIAAQLSATSPNLGFSCDFLNVEWI